MILIERWNVCLGTTIIDMMYKCIDMESRNKRFKYNV